MTELRREIEIDAPPERVWHVLTDFGSYPQWNPFITSIEGEPREGAKLVVRIAPPGGRAMTFRPIVRAARPNRELRWLGRVLLPGIFDGEHALTIEPLGEGRTRFVQSERFTGLLVPVTSGVLDKTARGFEQMNQALKERAESGA